MKVLHVIPFPGVGGSEIATRRLAEAVRPCGVESAVLLLAPTKDQEAYFAAAGLDGIASVRRPEPSLVRHALAFGLDSARLARLFATFDLIHCADVLAAYYVAIAGRMAQRPTICHVRNRAVDMPSRSKVFIGAAQHFVFVSEHTRANFPLRLPRHRTSVLYDGVDIPTDIGPETRAAAAADVRAEFGLPEGAVIAAMFARVNPQKDYETLVQAAALLRDSHPSLRFLVVGDNQRVELNRRHFQAVDRALRAAGLRDRFVFAGFRDDTRRLMLAADLSVLCTHFEGLPLALIEAMAAGCPCVATAVDGIPEVLAEPDVGLLHAHGDAHELAAAIAQLADHPAEARMMGARARAAAQARFSQERFARDAQALYNRLLGGSARPDRSRTQAAMRQDGEQALT